MRASSGTQRDSVAKSSHSRRMPAAAAIATRCMVWFVEPPVASSATIAFTSARSSTSSPSGAGSSPSGASATIRRPASRVSAWRSGVPGLTKPAPGSCSPIASTSSWFEFAVP